MVKVNRLLLISMVLLFVGCKSEKTRAINFSQLGWTLKLPIGLEFKDSVFDSFGNIPNFAWEEAQNGQQRTDLFQIRADRENVIYAIIYKDTTDLSAWKQELEERSRNYFDLFVGIPDLRILDSSVSVETFDGVEFQEEYINYRRKRNDMTFAYQYSRRYKNYAIYINIRYTDKKLGKRYLKLLENSEFEP